MYFAMGEIPSVDRGKHGFCDVKQTAGCVFLARRRTRMRHSVFYKTRPCPFQPPLGALPLVHRGYIRIIKIRTMRPGLFGKNCIMVTKSRLSLQNGVFSVSPTKQVPGILSHPPLV